MNAPSMSESTARLKRAEIRAAGRLPLPCPRDELAPDSSPRSPSMSAATLIEPWPSVGNVYSEVAGAVGMLGQRPSH